MHGEKKSLKMREKKIDTVLSGFKEFKDSKMSLVDILDYTDQFLSEQIEEQEKDFVEVNSDSSDEKINDIVEKKELKKIAQVMKEYKERVQKKIAELESKKSYIKKKIETSYSKYKTLKYNLHSVVIHEGGANGGHYFNLIYDSQEKKWRKYNDSFVTDISEEEVSNLSIGGTKSTCAAYCLFYVQDGCEMLDFETKNITSLKAGVNTELTDFYEKENSKFLTEYQHFKNNIMQNIKDEYVSKMNSLNFETAKFQNELKNKVFPSAPVLPGFNNYSFLEGARVSEVVRWNVLRGILQEKGIPYKILEGETNNYYYKELHNLITNMNIYSLKSLSLSEKQQNVLDIKKQEYLVLSKCNLAIQKIFELVGEKKWKEALCAVNFLHEKLNSIKIQDFIGYNLFSNYLLVVLSLKYCSLIDLSLSKGQTDEAMKLLELMVFALNRKQNIKIPQIFHQQILANLNNTLLTIGSQTLKEPEITHFKKYIKRIEDKVEYWPTFDLSEYESKV